MLGFGEGCYAGSGTALVNTMGLRHADWGWGQRRDLVTAEMILCSDSVQQVGGGNERKRERDLLAHARQSWPDFSIGLQAKGI